MENRGYTKWLFLFQLISISMMSNHDVTSYCVSSKPFQKSQKGTDLNNDTFYDISVFSNKFNRFIPWLECSRFFYLVTLFLVITILLNSRYPSVKSTDLDPRLGNNFDFVRKLLVLVISMNECARIFPFRPRSDEKLRFVTRFRRFF